MGVDAAVPNRCACHPPFVAGDRTAARSGALHPPDPAVLFGGFYPQYLGHAGAGPRKNPSLLPDHQCGNGTRFSADLDAIPCRDAGLDGVFRVHFRLFAQGCRAVADRPSRHRFFYP